MTMLMPSSKRAGLVRLFAPFLVLLATAACVAPPPEPQRVLAHVVRFQDFDQALAGQSFVIVALANQAQSAEFNQYRREIAARLAAMGLHPVERQDQADFIVTLDYAIGAYSASEVVEEYGTLAPSQLITTTQLRYDAVSGTYQPYESSEYIPAIQGVTGYHTVTETVYERSFLFRMFDLDRSSADDLYPAYEGTVTSSGAPPPFAGVSACLFDALFSNFLQPGTQDTSQLSSTCVR